MNHNSHPRISFVCNFIKRSLFASIQIVKRYTVLIILITPPIGPSSHKQFGLLIFVLLVKRKKVVKIIHYKLAIALNTLLI